MICSVNSYGLRGFGIALYTPKIRFFEESADEVFWHKHGLFYLSAEKQDVAGDE